MRLQRRENPLYDELLRKYPNTLIHTSGPFVGLPDGQMGNSEVGHMNMGAGRVVYMDVTRIDLMISTGEFFYESRAGECHEASARPPAASDGIVQRRRRACPVDAPVCAARNGQAHGLKDVFVHCFMDGRDTPPESGAGYIEQVEQKLLNSASGKIASVSGRYYAMDRDKRWDRIERAFGAMVLGNGQKAADGGGGRSRSPTNGASRMSSSSPYHRRRSQRASRSDPR